MTDKEKYILARWTYGLGEPIITDAEYNNLDRYFKETKELQEYTNRTWSEDPCPETLLEREHLEHLICHFEIEKTESIESITDMFAVKALYGNMSTKHYVSYKHDGHNIQVHYMNGKLMKVHSRGRSSDVLSYETLMSYLPQGIDRKEHTRVICEATLSEEGLKELQEKYPAKGLKTTRGSVRTALANKEDAHLIRVTAFDILGIDDMDVIIPTLKKWGFNTPVFTPVYDYDNLITVIKKMSENKAEYEKDYPTDAVVVRNAKERHLRALRVGNWEEGIYKTFVLGYIEEHTAYYIPMELEVYPVMIKGKTHTRVPITNLARVIENGLVIGAPIAFKIKSDATAIIDEDTTRILQQMYPNYAYYQQLVKNQLSL